MVAQGDGEDGTVSDDDAIERSARAQKGGGGQDVPVRQNGGADGSEHDASCGENVDGKLEEGGVSLRTPPEDSRPLDTYSCLKGEYSSNASISRVMARRSCSRKPATAERRPGCSIQCAE